MIQKIYFSNYRLFRDRQELELKPMTIIIGKNSAGKSSITKLLTLIEGSLKGIEDLPISLENDRVSLGVEFTDLLYGKVGTRTLDIGLENTEQKYFDVNIRQNNTINSNSGLPIISKWEFNHSKSFAFNIKSRKNYIDENGREQNVDFNGFHIENDNSLNENGFKLTTNYIGPYRYVPKRLIEGRLKRVRDGKLGKDGYKTYPFLVYDALHNNGKILNEISQWFKKNFQDWGLKIEKRLAPYSELLLSKENPFLEINFSDVGQGMIQSLPLLLSSFIPSPTIHHIDVFEQPELHLHPAAHGDLAKRFATSTKELNKRYLIETHSQNFILRLRRMVAEKTYNHEDIVIYFVDFDEEQGCSSLKRINIDIDGDVDFWPEGVFSETLDETVAIRTAQLENPYL